MGMILWGGEPEGIPYKTQGKKTPNSTKNLESGSEQGPSAPPCDHQECACIQSISYSHALLSIFDLNTEPWHQFRNHFTIVMLNAEGRLCLPALHGVTCLYGDLFRLVRLARCPPALHYSQWASQGAVSPWSPHTSIRDFLNKARILLAHIQRASCTCVLPRSLTALNINVSIISEAPAELRNADPAVVREVCVFPSGRTIVKINLLSSWETALCLKAFIQAEEDTRKAGYLGQQHAFQKKNTMSRCTLQLPPYFSQICEHAVL